MHLQNMQIINGIQNLLGWKSHQNQIEFGDEHEILYQKIEALQQKNEEDDHVQKDIIYQVQKIGWI